MLIQLTKKQGQAELAINFLFDGQKPAIEISKVALSDFKNQIGTTHLVYLQDRRVLLVGLGKKGEFDFGKLRVAVHQAISAAIGLKIQSADIILPKIAAGAVESWLEVLGFAIHFSAYRFNRYKKDQKENNLEQINIIGSPSARFIKALQSGEAIGLAANSSRDLANHPGNVATPSHLAQHAIAIAKKYKFNYKILGPKEIAREKLGLLLGVSQGSDQPPRFIILEYGKSSKPPIVLVGKGLTFDSGGVSIKPAERMEEMKFDMAGGATVLGIFEAVAALKLPVHIVGLIPSSENLISGKAVKPGDILIAHDKTSVEIINTDAEGRLVLADAISYAKKYYQPKLIIDYATLTGAIVVALGDQYTGYYSNEKAFEKLFASAAKLTAEAFWRLPLASEYSDQLKSLVADIKNIGEKNMAGATTAALFLEHFVGSTPWIHLDTAGTAWTMRPKPYASAGATAWGVYLTVDFLRNLKP